MTEPAAPHAPATLPPASANGSAPPPRPAPAAPRRRLKTRISGMRTALIAGTAVLIVVLIFIIQNAHAADAGRRPAGRGGRGPGPRGRAAG